jgi:D-alanyl-D-alanine carboxypeptidase
MHLLYSSLASLLVFAAGLRTQDARTGAAIDAYIAPYARTNNFAGAVLVERSGAVLFEHAYGLADRERRQLNTTGTSFHIASISMQFTAAAVLRLVDAGAVRLEDSVGELLPGTPGADRITIRDLLTERSGVPDINDLPDYADILRHHQTPASLVARVSGRPLLFPPGSTSLHEEHSAYNLLALVIERATHLPFAAAVQHLVFEPLHLTGSFIDDDSASSRSEVAHGYAPSGVTGLVAADAIYWSGKAGNGSACTSVEDEARWVDSLFEGRFLSASSRSVVLDTTPDAGYGWFRGTVPPLGVAYHMSGRAPGFASFVLHLPAQRLTVVVLSNIYSSATIPMGYDIARIALGLPHDEFQPRESPPVARRGTAGRFQFGPDFYQRNAVLELIPSDSAESLRWPTGFTTVLIPTRDGAFVDRSYWVPVRILRDGAGRVTGLAYGKFHGQHTSAAPAQ